MSTADNSTKTALLSLRSNALNLQALLCMAAKGDNATVILDKITKAIRNHFDRVEALGIDIPEENRRDHKALLVYFKSAEADWRQGRLSDVDYAEALNARLYSHFSVYFKGILDSHLNDKFLADFRL